MDIRKTARKSQHKTKSLRSYVQCLVLVLVSLTTVIIGFLVKPSSVSAPNANLFAPQVDIIAARKDVRIYDISSTLMEEGDSAEYTLIGTVRVPPGKPSSLYVSIDGAGQVSSPHSGWKSTNYGLTSTFIQGISKLQLQVVLEDCDCVSYVSPYLEANTAIVYSSSNDGEADIPGILGTPSFPAGPPWSVTLSFRQSEVDLEDFTVPSDLSIVAAFPQSPINTTHSSYWSWPNAASGHFNAIDLDASASRDMHLFYAGLIFGIAGSAIVGAIQAFFAVQERDPPKTENRRRPRRPTGRRVAERRRPSRPTNPRSKRGSARRRGLGPPRSASTEIPRG